MLADIVDKDYKQGNLFEPLDYVHSDSLMKTIDKINITLGKNAVFFASQVVRREWQMKRGNRSPRYMTKWAEMLEV